MQYNLWVLADQLSEFEPILHLSEAEAQIEGLRVAAGDEDGLDPRYVYLCPEHDAVALKNGADSILLPHASPEKALNAVLAVFEQLQAWETELNRLTAERSLQGLLDHGGSLMENPLMLSDSAGNVLAMSTAFLSEDINAYWCTARDAGHVPLEVLGAPMYDEDGTLRSWGDVPTRYHTQDGDRLIGSYIRVGGSRAAGLGLWEHGRPIRKGDLLLFGMLCEAIAAALEEKPTENAGRAMADILRDLLDGRKIEASLLSRMELGCKRPWQLLLIANPFRADSIYRQSLLYRLAHSPRPNISFLYENRVLVLASEKDTAALSQEIVAENGKTYYQLVLSLPFDELKDMPARYRQCDYAMAQTREQPGIYNSEYFCFAYLLSQFSAFNGEQNLAHPALAVLKRHDQEKNTEYYRTLFVYLLYERSILLGSEHLHIHKNSFLYRIQKIRDMLDVDLEDPEVRQYLMLSYYLEGER